MVVAARIACILFVIFVWLVLPGASYSQELPGVAVNIEINGEVSEGDILSITKDGLKKSSVEFDSAIYGVIVSAPVLSIEPRTDKTHAVVTSGFARVKVDAVDEVEVGDFITTSAAAGVGKKATRSGYVLGKALEPYSDKSKPGFIPVEVTIGYADIGGQGLSQNIIGRIFATIDPAYFWRYVLAAVVGLVTFAASTFAFVKFLTSGVTALGRNPLARVTIMSGMIVSSLVIAAIAASGFGVALAIINFKLPFLG